MSNTERKTRWDESGICMQDNLRSILQKHSCEKECFIAFFSDHFYSGRIGKEMLDSLFNDINQLLEIRVFSDEQELLAVRSMVGAKQPFQWRIASENGLSDDQWIKKNQTLDIDRKRMEKLTNGNLQLKSTGGGEYELPIDENMTQIEVISYIDYDSDGMAYIFDHRLKRFM